MEPVQKLRLSSPQHIFLNELNTKYRAFIGGFGSGKTYVGCLDLLIFALQHPGIPQAYFGPTYPSIRDIFWPAIEKAAKSMRIFTQIIKEEKRVILFNSNGFLGDIICRSMERPEKIVGFEVARALVDEIDTLKSDKAEAAWTKIVARLRHVVPGIVNGIGVTCTPEGFGFAYERFKKNPTARYSMVQASTYENMDYLPDDYIAGLYETYPQQLVRAYIMGQFVNLTAGTVYYAFDRNRHNAMIEPNPKEKLHIGMDFNVTDMCAVVHVERDNNTYAVAELFGIRDTPDMCEVVKEKYPGHPIYIYPDASGRGTTSKSASESDMTILKRAKFQVRAHNTNPLIKNRVATVNNQFEKGKYFVNVAKCPELTLAFEQQPYDPKTQQPLKDGTIDNRVDAPGYYMHYRFPIVRRSAVAEKLAKF